MDEQIDLQGLEGITRMEEPGILVPFWPSNYWGQKGCQLS